MPYAGGALPAAGEPQGGCLHSGAVSGNRLVRRACWCSAAGAAGRIVEQCLASCALKLPEEGTAVSPLMWQAARLEQVVFCNITVVCLRVGDGSCLFESFDTFTLIG